jgi:hypothetical protein
MKGAGGTLRELDGLVLPPWIAGVDRSFSQNWIACLLFRFINVAAYKVL